MPTNLVITGAAGRMGRRIIALSADDRDVQLVGAMEAAQNAAIGTDAGELAGIGRTGLIVTAQPPDSFDVMIDFSTPDGTLNRRRRLPTIDAVHMLRWNARYLRRLNSSAMAASDRPA